MKHSKKILFAGLSLMLVIPPSWAAKAKHAGQVVPKPASTSIERGGMITSVDPTQKTLSIDGVNYPLLLANSSSGAQRLKQGDLVQFTTERDGAKGVDRVTQVQVATPPPPAKASPLRKR